MTVSISVTTIASRIELCRRTCESLAGQTVVADEIVLRVSGDPYLLDSGLHESMLDWTRGMCGLRVEWVENLGPYRKLVPALATACPGDMVVTVDDDAEYAPTWLETLLSAAASHSNAIVCGCARRPGYNFMGRRLGYWAWPSVDPGTLEVGLIPIGLCGVVYRPEVIDVAWATDQAFRTIAATTDDLWFAEAARRCGSPVFVAPGAASLVVPLQSPTTLFELNGGGREAWPNFRRRMSRRVMSRLGVPCCVNDLNYAQVLEYSSKSK